MSLIAYVLVILLSFVVRVHSKALSEDDGLSIADLKKANDEDRKEQVRRELSLKDEESAEADLPSHGVTVKGFEEGHELTSRMSTNGGPSDLKKAMENEGGDQNLNGATNKSKREICDRILEQLRDLPCESPVVITCAGENRMYPCVGDQSGSPLRTAVSDFGNILRAAEVDPQPQVPQPVEIPSVVPSIAEVSPMNFAVVGIQTLPISTPSMAASPFPSRPFMLQPRILTAEERREKQKAIFEGLLRFGTVVNHIDSFLTDKGKMIIRGLHRMVQSEEDSRFS